MPATVVTYTAATQVAKVKPLLKRAVVGEDGTTIQEELPEIPQVPVMFPRGGGYFLTFPLVPGDMVMLIFMDKSIDGFMLSAGNIAQDQIDLRMHHLTDAVAIPGFYPLTKPIQALVQTDAVFGAENNAQVRAKGSTVDVTTAGAIAAVGGFVALANLVSAELTKIQTALNTHVHTGVTTGPGSSGPSVSGYVPGAVASTNLKAD
jgi:hypothetical protein